MPAEPQHHISTVGEGETEDPHQPVRWEEIPNVHPRDWSEWLRRYCAPCHLS